MIHRAGDGQTDPTYQRTRAMLLSDETNSWYAEGAADHCCWQFVDNCAPTYCRVLHAIVGPGGVTVFNSSTLMHPVRAQVRGGQGWDRWDRGTAHRVRASRCTA